MSRSEANVDRVWALMKDISVAMVVTHDGNFDDLRARPMAARTDPDANAIYFLTDAGAPKDAEVEANDHVCLTFSDNSAKRYVSVTGHANVSNDRMKIKELWTTADAAFWRDENDPAIRLFRVSPTGAEYWEGPGLVSGYVKFLAARVTGARPELNKSEKVSFT